MRLPDNPGGRQAMLWPLHVDLSGNFRCFDPDQPELVLEGKWIRWGEVPDKPPGWRGRENLIRTGDGRWLTGWQVEDLDPCSGISSETRYTPRRETPDVPAFREIGPEAAMALMRRLELEPTRQLIDDAAASADGPNRESNVVSACTIGDLLGEISSPGSHEGVDRLSAIANREWGAGLNRRNLGLLRDHIERILRHQGLRGFGIDRVDAIGVDDGAEILEASLRGQGPGARLLDQCLEKCRLCDEPLAESDRALGRASCHKCRTGVGRMLELDLAIKTGVGATYSQCGTDPLGDLFPEWRELRSRICDQLKTFKIDRDVWEHFRNSFMNTHGKNENEFLCMKQTEVLDLLRPAQIVVPPADESRAATPGKTPRGDGETLNASVAKYLSNYPNATVADINKATGVSTGFISECEAWQNRPNKNRPNKKSHRSNVRAMQATPALANVPWQGPDPSDQVADNDLLQRQYIERASEPEKAIFYQMPPEKRREFLALEAEQQAEQLKDKRTRRRSEGNFSG